MTAADVDRRFAQYLATITACGRGEREAEALLEHFSVPLMFVTDAGVATLASDADVVGALAGQVDGMRASGYDHSDVLDSQTTVLNAFAALHRARLARFRKDGSEIGRLEATYLLAGAPDALLIAALIVHTA